MMARRDHEQRPTRDRKILGLGWRHLDLIHAGRTFLRRRGVEHSRLGGILLHRIDGPDPGLDLHDHPWPFLSIVLRGGYTEEALYEPGDSHRGTRRTWRRWSAHRMPLNVAHSIVDVQPGTVTLVLRGRKVRRWGFYLPTGWVDWAEYDYDARRPNTVISSDVDERMVQS